jgi:hypothetical protein
MKKKIFALLILSCILLPSLILGAYQFGADSSFNNGKTEGYALGYSKGRLATSGSDYRSFQEGNQTGFLAGYEAGLKAQNITVP